MASRVEGAKRAPTLLDAILARQRSRVEEPNKRGMTLYVFDRSREALALLFVRVRSEVRVGSEDASAGCGAVRRIVKGVTRGTVAESRQTFRASRF
jgi:hypothetical protein